MLHRNDDQADVCVFDACLKALLTECLAIAWSCNHSSKPDVRFVLLQVNEDDDGFIE